MKTLTIISSIIVLSSTLNSPQAISDGGRITFTGAITESTCQVQINNSHTNATISLPPIKTNQLTSAGQSSGTTPFTITLSDCPRKVGSVTTGFEAGSVVDIDTGRLANTHGTAANVELELLDTVQRVAIKASGVNQKTNAIYTKLASGAAKLPYAVRYYSKGQVRSGTVGSTIIYSMSYK